MNSKLNKILATTLITAMILAVIPAFAQPSEPHDASAIWLEPSELTGPVGTTFLIYCWTNVSDLGFTYQAKVWWDPTIFKLNWMQHTAGDVDGWDWLDQRDPGPDMIYGSTSLPGPVIGSDNAQLGGTCMGDDFVPAYTVGKLFKAEFEVISAPPKGGEIDTYITLDDADTYILNPGLSDVPSTKYNSHYHQDWALPPKPHLAVDPDLFEFGPNPPTANGTLFDAGIYVKDMDLGWWLHNVTLYLDWNTTLINMTNIVFGSLWGTTDYSYTDGGGVVLDELYIEVKDPASTPGGDVLIATITFNVTFQRISPPFYDPEISPLDIHDYELWDTDLLIPTDPEVDGEVIIYPMQILELPYLEVSNTTMGPEPCRGEKFNVTVSIKNLDVSWYLVGVDFRLTYDKDLIEPVTVYEGPFLPGFAANQTGSLGTWYASYFEDCYYCNYSLPHVLFGGMILPNSSGLWTPPFPEGEGVLATITFKVLYQSYGEENMTGPLDIIENLAVALDDPDPAKQNMVDIPLDDPVNGVYEITTTLPGRMLDLYGGALNEGYGSHPFPAPYGGQGPNNPMDMVTPQSEVCFFAEVTYNYWPVQNKIVSYEVEYPDGSILLKLTAVTDDDGIAMICFEMPWPCEDPESLFGVWTVTTTVSISDIRVKDTLTFHYDYMVKIWKVTTDMFEYDHCEDVEITIEYGTHAQQSYPVLISVLILDELIVPVGMVLLETEVGGAEYCTYANFTTTVTIHVPKYAFAGIATIHVNAFDKDPTEGGVAWCPEYTPQPEICIQPY